MRYRKKLIESSLPLSAINAASAREKAIRHGHPSTIHLWWARRPLASCRAVLFASLVDDPSQDPMFAGDEDIEANKRAELFNLIEDLVQWGNSDNPRIINKARAEIARCIASSKIEAGELRTDYVIQCSHATTDSHFSSSYTSSDIKQMLAPPHAVNHFLATYGPSVLDPFCGGGSIPLEAKRLGLRAYGTDLNPVSILITKALVEFPSQFANNPPVNPEWKRESPQRKAATVWAKTQGLVDDIRYYGNWMREEAKKQIGDLYPGMRILPAMAKDRPDLVEYIGGNLNVIAWLWARTVASPNPAAGGAHVPLVRSFWLSTKAGKKAWIEPIVNASNMSFRFEVRVGKGEPPSGTVGRNCDRCLLTGAPMTREYIRSEAQAGRMGVRLMAIVAEGRVGRLYLSPVKEHEMAAQQAVAPDDAPDAEITGDVRYLTPTTYGMKRFRDLFTNRQLIAMSTYCDVLLRAHKRIVADAKCCEFPDDGRQLATGGCGAAAYADVVATYLGLGVSKLADAMTSLTRWKPSMDQAIATFGRQALPMVWDYAESNTFNGKAGDYCTTLGTILRAIAALPVDGQGTASQGNAVTDIDPELQPLLCTDPPYYDNVPYADLSDFFYVWLRRCLRSIHPQLLNTMLVPKSDELVADPFRHGGREEARCFFEKGMSSVLMRMQKACRKDLPMTIFYAFKQAEAEEEEDDNDGENTGSTSHVSTGWQTFLQGLVDAEWQINGTWPMRTELGNRMRTIASNALASSIVLACRARATDAPIASRREFILALKRELPDSLKRLQEGNIAPVDLAQAAIGPGMAVFTRYSKVMETDGAAMSVRTALGLINQALDEVLAEQEGEFDSDTRWAVAWFEQFGIEEGPFGEGDVLARAKNTSVNGLVEAGVVKSRAGKVQLLKRDELPDDWNPTTDKRLTVWEVTQHLIRTVEQKGESAAAALLHQLGGLGEVARDLAYRLYTICERKKWAEEALAYNGLVIAWSELSKLALSERTKPATQAKLFE